MSGYYFASLEARNGANGWEGWLAISERPSEGCDGDKSVQLLSGSGGTGATGASEEFDFDDLVVPPPATLSNSCSVNSDCVFLISLLMMFLLFNGLVRKDRDYGSTPW